MALLHKHGLQLWLYPSPLLARPNRNTPFPSSLVVYAPAHPLPMPMQAALMAIFSLTWSISSRQALSVWHFQLFLPNGTSWHPCLICLVPRFCLLVTSVLPTHRLWCLLECQYSPVSHNNEPCSPDAPTTWWPLRRSSPCDPPCSVTDVLFYEARS